MSKNKPVKIKRALISVSNKEGIVNFAKKLHKFNIEIISTGGTEKILKKNKIPVISVEKFSGSPEMMEGRVKTLVPQIHGGILSRRKKDRDEIKKHGIKEIDLVVVNFYPFKKALQRNNHNEILENIDIGGPALVRAAAKNYKYTVVVTHPQQYQQLSFDEISEASISPLFFLNSLRLKIDHLFFLALFCISLLFLLMEHP